MRGERGRALQTRREKKKCTAKNVKEDKNQWEEGGTTTGMQGSRRARQCVREMKMGFGLRVLL